MKLSFKYKNYGLSMHHIDHCHDILINHRKFTAELSGRCQFIRLNAQRLLTGMKLAARGIAFLATAIFETIVLFFGINRRKSLIAAQIRNDLAQLGEERRSEIKCLLEDLIKTHGLFKEKSEEKKNKYLERALATYASSRSNYGNVMNEWVLSLLETALCGSTPKRLVFMARDGIAPYEVAKIFAEKYPDTFGKVPLTLLYLSRKVSSWSKESEENRQMLIDYARQQGIKDNENCIFVDIGFYGTTIDIIKDTLKEITPPKNIEFEFFVSYTPKAKGFMGNMETPFSSVRAPGSLRIVEWLEDNHQGVRNSATKLEREENGKVSPYLIDSMGRETCIEMYEKSYFYKLAGMMAIQDSAKEANISKRLIEEITQNPTPWKMVTENMKVTFDDFLKKYISGERVSFCKHF